MDTQTKDQTALASTRKRTALALWRAAEAIENEYDAYRMLAQPTM